MDRKRMKRILIVAALLIALVTLVAPASAATANEEARTDANNSYHAMLPPVVPGAANLMNWPYGSRMFDKWCGLPNMVMTYSGMDYDQMLQAFTGAQGEMMASMMDPSNTSLWNFTMVDDTAVWNLSQAHLNKTLLNEFNMSGTEDLNVSIYTADMAEWMEEGSCGDCHVGGGGLAGQDSTYVKCGNCHSSVDGEGFNSNTGDPAATPNATTGFLGDTSCETAEFCHGHDGPKHDMKFEEGYDIHAGSAEFAQIAIDAGYGNNTCLNCHQPGLDGNNHNFGRPNSPDTAFDYSTTGTMRACDNVDCHGANGGPHTNAILNQHTDKMVCFVCHTSKETIGVAYDTDDWTVVNSSKTFGSHNLVYYWASNKTGGDFGPNVNALGVDTDYIIYPFVGSSMKAYAGMWPFLDSNPNTFPGVDNVKIRPAEEFTMSLWVYMNMGAMSDTPLWASMMGIDKDLLWAMDEAGNDNGTVEMNELIAAGYKPINVDENGMPLGSGPAFTPFKFVAYPKLGIHNINRGGSLDAPYTCDDCHGTGDNVLDFADLGITSIIVGPSDSVHTSVLTENTTIAPNECSSCHGTHIPTAQGNRTMINTTTINAPSDVGDFNVSNVTLTDVKGAVTSLTAGFVPTRYDIDFGTASTVGLKIRDVYIDGSSVISATVDSSIDMPKPLSPDMTPLVNSLFDVSVNSTIDDGVRYTVTIPYDPTQLGEYGAQTLRMFHYNEVSGEWEDCTTSINVQDQTVTGTTTSLSPFVVAVWPDATTATAFSGLGMISLMGLFIMFVAVISRRRDE